MRSESLGEFHAFRSAGAWSFLPGRVRPFVWLRAAVAACAAIAALVLVAREGLRHEEAPPRPVRPAVLVAPAPAWTAIPEAKPHYAIDIARLKALPQIHEARRHANDGREDKLVYGVFESDQPYLRLALFRGPREERPASFFLDLARRAGEAGLAVVRSGPSTMIATKLGPVEIAEAVLADAFERPCLGFRLRPEEEGLALHGWYCAAAEQEGLSDAACLIDRLVLLPAADDLLLKALFAQADRRRNPACQPPPTPRRKGG